MDFVDRPTTLLPEDARLPAHPGHGPAQGVFARIGAELAHLDPEARTRRVATTARFVVSALATWERESTTGIAPDLDAFEKELTALALALLLAP